MKWMRESKEASVLGASRMKHEGVSYNQVGDVDEESGDEGEGRCYELMERSLPVRSITFHAPSLHSTSYSTKEMSLLCEPEHRRASGSCTTASIRLLPLITTKQSPVCTSQMKTVRSSLSVHSLPSMRGRKQLRR